MSDSCAHHQHDHCHTPARKDWLYMISLFVIAITYILHLVHVDGNMPWF